jgi:hypothetical protein
MTQTASEGKVAASRYVLCRLMHARKHALAFRFWLLLVLILLTRHRIPEVLHACQPFDCEGNYECLRISILDKTSRYL